uniref:Uncharacterized protein n=1 Tax=Ditylenchus dipsaci TaxID=166011 RepID=A0A915DLS2_9BILA
MARLSAISFRCLESGYEKNITQEKWVYGRNKANSSCFGFRPRVQIPTKTDCMDSRTMEWVRDQLKQFNQMQKPCLINEQHTESSSRQVNLLKSRAQFRKMRRHSTQFLMEFDKILSFKRSISNIEALTKLPQVNGIGAPDASDIITKKMTMDETVNVLSSIFKSQENRKMEPDAVRTRTSLVKENKQTNLLPLLKHNLSVA